MTMEMSKIWLQMALSLRSNQGQIRKWWMAGQTTKAKMMMATMMVAVTMKNRKKGQVGLILDPRKMTMLLGPNTSFPHLLGLLPLPMILREIQRMLTNKEALGVRDLLQVTMKSFI